MLSKKSNKTYSFRSMPQDVYRIVLKEQNRIKEEKSRSQYSLELTIYHIIREFEKCRENPK